MTDGTTQISVAGKMTQVPSMPIDGRTVISRGKWLKVASVHDEPFLEGEVVANPESFLTRLKQWHVKPDVFKFAQKITSPDPKFKFPMEWDNFAVLPITTYEEWLQKQAKKDVKENLRRAKREGVVVKTCEFNDEFVRGIKSLYDETPVRQGRPFWHYRKDFEKVRAENGTYLERSEYIGAFYEGELIGFIKMVYVGNYAKTMQVITKEKYFYKRPANAMIAKAVEVCAEKGIRYLNYGPYDYPGKKQNSLTEFKSRHGFVRFNFPRFYVPLTVKGKIYLALGLHRGLKRMIPTRMLTIMLGLRSAIYHNVILPLKWMVFSRDSEGKMRRKKIDPNTGIPRGA
jgi:hypothetical protein